MSTTDPGWYRDPAGRFASRYWDGRQWTDQVSSGGANAIDELPDDMLFVPPAPGTESVSMDRAPVQITQQSPRSAVGTVVAVVLGIIVVVVLVFALANQSGDDGSTTVPSEPTPTTQAPPPTDPTPADG